MIILDTDCLSLLDREKLVESSKLRRKLEQFFEEVPILTVEDWAK